MKPEEFIEILRIAAKNSAKITGIPASFTIADAALETGWGGHLAGGFNLFGVKADKSWHGYVSTKNTREESSDGSWKIIPQVFRKYNSWQESLDDHAKFLLTNPRYKNAFKCKTGVAFAQAVAMAGYATDHDYAQKVITIINRYNLKDLDV